MGLVDGIRGTSAYLDTEGIKLPDAIHLASARAAGCETVLTNDQQLKAVSDLHVILCGEVIPA